jgi:hypothetical protein
MTQTEQDPLENLEWPEPPAPGSEVSLAIRKTCTRDLACAKGLKVTHRLLLSVAVSGGIVALLVALGLRHPNTDGGALRVALIGAAGWGVVHAAVLFFGLARPPGRRGARGLRIALAIGLPILFFAYLAVAATTRLPVDRFVHEGLGRAGSCGIFSLLFGTVAAGGTLLLWRRTDPLTPGLSGAIAGLLGGLSSAVGIGVACPTHEGWHLWVTHGMTVVLFVFVGWVVGRRWLAP